MGGENDGKWTERLYAHSPHISQVGTQCCGKIWWGGSLWLFNSKHWMNVSIGSFKKIAAGHIRKKKQY